jgi:DNA polymerase III alpha subunit (gram-positive type)
VLCDHLLISIFDRHRATGDAEATVYLLKHQLKKIAKDHNVATWADLETFLRPQRRKKARPALEEGSPPLVGGGRGRGLINLP